MLPDDGRADGAQPRRHAPPAGLLGEEGHRRHRRGHRRDPHHRGPAGLPRPDGTRSGIDQARSRVAKSLLEAKEIAQDLAERDGGWAGFQPIVIRPSFTMGGAGGGIVWKAEDFDHKVTRGLELSPVHEVLIEECLFGWKEYELELLRDANDNVVIICSIENVDPMGVHTGDSVTVAPQQTLTDPQYQRMRDAAIRAMRSIGTFAGGCNIQFAVDPATGRMIVIEINPRVSRSSALACKATGYPIAKVAARLAVGYTLDELPNEITGTTSACFEPALDYVVTKMPRFNFDKFEGVDEELTTQMKAVGEVDGHRTDLHGEPPEGVAGPGAGLRRPRRRPPAPRPRRGPPERLAKPLLGPPAPDPQRLPPGHVASRKSHDITKVDPWFLDPDPPPRGAGARTWKRTTLAALDREAAAGAQAARLLRRADRLPRQGRDATEADVRAQRAEARPRADLPRGGHLRGRVRGRRRRTSTRRTTRARPSRVRDGPQEGAHPRLRPQPDRAGHRVRLLVRPRRARGQGDGLRDHHDQLQPGDGLDRLRRRRQALLRAGLLGARRATSSTTSSRKA